MYNINSRAGAVDVAALLLAEKRDKQSFSLVTTGENEVAATAACSHFNLLHSAQVIIADNL